MDKQLLNDEQKTLLDSANSSAQVYRATFFTFLVAVSYLLAVTFSVEHRDLFLNSELQAPVLNIGVKTSYYFIAAPYIVLFFHFALLLQTKFLSFKATDYYDSVQNADDLEKTKALRLLHSVPLLQTLAYSTGIGGLLLKLYVFASMVLLPNVALLLIIFKFLPYQSFWISIQQCIVLSLDLGLIFFIFWECIFLKNNNNKYSENFRGFFKYIKKRSSIVIFILITLVLMVLTFLPVSCFKGKALGIVGKNIISYKTLQLPQKRLYIDPSRSPETACSEDNKTLAVDLTKRSFQNANLAGSILCYAVLQGVDLREANLQGADLRGAKLQGEDLRKVKLQGEDLRKVKLQGENLRGADLRGANLQGVDFSEANLSDADLRGADLKDATLQGADLSKADLRGADLKDAHLQEVDWRETDLSKAKLQKVDLSDAKLQGAYWRGVDLSDATLQRAYLRGVDLSDATLQGAYLRGADLQKADLSDAKLQRADLQKADLSNATLQRANLSYATLQRANLQGADLFRATLQGADLSKAKLQGANLQRATLQGADLRRAKLQGANLQRANLQGADLFRANLGGANLGGAHLQGADLNEAYLIGSNLSGVGLQGAILLGADFYGVTSKGKDFGLSQLPQQIRQQIDKETEMDNVIFEGIATADFEKIVQDLNLVKENLSEKNSDNSLSIKRIDFVIKHIKSQKGKKLKMGKDINLKDYLKQQRAFYGSYTSEDAERWIQEYNKATSNIIKK